MHSSRKGTERRRRCEIACRRQPAGRARGAREANHAGAAPAGGSDFHNKEEAVAVAQESEFLAVNQKIRVRISAVTPFHHARDAAVVEAADCKSALTRCESGRALHFGAIVQ